MANELPSFLGTGWAFPPSFSVGGKEVETVSGVEDIHQSLEILLGTEPGERVMQELFGCNLQSVLFEEVDQRLVNRVIGLVSDAILEHEPRIALDRVDVVPNEPDAGWLQIAIQYTVRGTNSRFNMVYPFYLEEAAVSGTR